MVSDVKAMEGGRVRPPAVAGMFYPSSRRELESVLAQCFALAAESDGVPRPKALIAPHAGYIYSGPVAASAYSLLPPYRGEIRHVVLLGPSHYVPFRGLATSSADFFLTPLGSVELDPETKLTLRELPWIRERDDAHAREHSLEVHLPFLQTVLDDFRLTPLVAGDATPPEVGKVLELVWGGPETLIVVSTDLSHYHPYELARKIDESTSEAIQALDPSAVDGNRACGYVPLNGLLWEAGRRGLHLHVLDERNSGDTAGDRSRVVGYGAYAIAE